MNSLPQIIVSVLLYISLAPNLQAQNVNTEAANRQLAEYFKTETRKLSQASLRDIKSIKDWNAQKTIWREQLFEMLGLSPRPAKTDLQVTYTGTTEHEEFIVKKLHYQSRPQLYVTGNLYLPKKIDRKLPAILYVCGHGRVKKNGKSYGNKVHYHHHGSWFARNGYVCLTIDTLQLGEIEGIHHGTYREKMWWWLNRGYTPAGVEAWNCIRALDLLQSLPEVDGDRIGVTGRSGGGAYSWWIAALDERIKCAVPVAGITDLENHVVDGCVEGHCDCMFMVNTYRWDYPQVAALVAPRPLLISNTDNDGIFPLDGVYRTYSKVRKIYELHGATKNVAFHITAGPHQDTQELRIHAFRWLNYHLKGDDSLIDKPATKFFEPEQLNVFDELPGDQKNSQIHESFVPVAKVTVPSELGRWKQQAAKLEKAIKEKCFRGLPTESSALQIKMAASDSRDDLVCDTIQFKSQAHVPLELALWYNSSRLRGEIHKFTLCVLDDRDADLQKADLNKPEVAARVWSRIKGMSDKKFESLADYLNEKEERGIVFFTPRGVGVNRWNPDAKFQTQTRRRFYLLGQTADTMRIYDLKRAADVLQKIHGIEQPDITINAQGAMAICAVYASLFQEQVKSLELLNPTSSHRQGPFLLNINRVCDVPHSIAVAAEGNRKISIRSDDPEKFSFARTTSSLGQRKSNLNFVK